MNGYNLSFNNAKIEVSVCRTNNGWTASAKYRNCNNIATFELQIDEKDGRSKKFVMKDNDKYLSEYYSFDEWAEERNRIRAENADNEVRVYWITCDTADISYIDVDDRFVHVFKILQQKFDEWIASN